MNARFENIQKGDSIPIVIVHGDEANKLLPKYLPNNIPVYLYKHMGNEKREYPIDTIEGIASVYANHLLEKIKEDTFILSGYSIGGVIAYQMMHQLKENNKKVHLIILDSKTPRLEGKHEFHNRQVKWDESKFKKAYKRYSKKLILGYYKISRTKMKKKHFFFYRMQQYRKARLNYTPTKYDGDVTLIKSTQDNYKNPTLGWDNFTNNVEVFTIDCNHHEITTEPNIQVVADIFNNIHKAFKAQIELK